MVFLRLHKRLHCSGILIFEDLKLTYLTARTGVTSPAQQVAKARLYLTFRQHPYSILFRTSPSQQSSFPGSYGCEKNVTKLNLGSALRCFEGEVF